VTGPQDRDGSEDWGFPEVDPASTELPDGLEEEPVGEGPFDTGSDAWWRAQAAAQRKAAAGEPPVPPRPPAPAPVPEPPPLVEPQVLLPEPPRPAPPSPATPPAPEPVTPVPPPVTRPAPEAPAPSPLDPGWLPEELGIPTAPPWEPPVTPPPVTGAPAPVLRQDPTEEIPRVREEEPTAAPVPPAAVPPAPVPPTAVPPAPVPPTAVPPTAVPPLRPAGRPAARAAAPAPVQAPRVPAPTEPGPPPAPVEPTPPPTIPPFSGPAAAHPGVPGPDELQALRTDEPADVPRGRALLGAALALAGVLLGIGALYLLREEEPGEGPTVVAPTSTATSAAPTSTPAPSTQPTPTADPTPTTGATPTTAATTPPASVAPAPIVPVTVLNNSRVSGLADRSAERFRAGGWPVRATGNYRGGVVAETTVYYGPGQLASAQRFARQFDIPRVRPRFSGLPSTGLTVVLTRDYA